MWVQWRIWRATISNYEKMTRNRPSWWMRTIRTWDRKTDRTLASWTIRRSSKLTVKRRWIMSHKCSSTSAMSTPNWPTPTATSDYLRFTQGCRTSTTACPLREKRPKSGTWRSLIAICTRYGIATRCLTMSSSGSTLIGKVAGYRGKSSWLRITDSKYRRLRKRQRRASTRQTCKMTTWWASWVWFRVDRLLLHSSSEAWPLEALTATRPSWALRCLRSIVLIKRT